MPEKTKTGKWIYPIRDATDMKKDGWFVRPTKTKGVSVRLAKLKKDNTTVVQAYIFDTKKGWDQSKIEKWLKDQDVKWIASLDEESDTLSSSCLNIVVVDSIIEEGEEAYMAAQEIKAITDIPVTSVVVDNGLPKEIVNVPKRIVTHRSRKKGSNGRPINNLNGKDYGKKAPDAAVDSSNISVDPNKCGDKDKSKVVPEISVESSNVSIDSEKCGGGGGKEKDKGKGKLMVRTPKKI
jgi:hypothetical protein